jgi:tRNA threonylcarbamoyladenosine biosynthesis protein TsaE
MEQPLKILSERDLQDWLQARAFGWRQQAQAGGFSIALNGIMGAGKTTLVRLLAEHFGVVGEVSSPSYVLQYEYRVASNFLIEHWDLYRLHDLPDELYEPAPSSVLRIIEWANKFEQQLVVDCSITLEFTSVDSTETARQLSYTLYR